MEIPTMRELLEAGVHFGHQTARWNPKMKPFIFGARENVHIFDLEKTHAMLEEVVKFLQSVVQKGGVVLFVGTKRQASALVQEAAQACGMPYVNFRWTGGLLTNFDTIRRRIKRMKELEENQATGEWGLATKKEILLFQKELADLVAIYDGIRELKKTPDALFIIDTGKEAIAVREARRLEIPVVGLVDTNSDPDMVDYVIPSNDDAIRAIELMAGTISDAISEVKNLAAAKAISDSDKEEKIKLAEEVEEAVEEIEEKVLGEEREEEGKKRVVKTGKDKEI